MSLKYQCRIKRAAFTHTMSYYRHGVVYNDVNMTRILIKRMADAIISTPIPNDTQIFNLS